MNELDIFDGLTLASIIAMAHESGLLGRHPMRVAGITFSADTSYGQTYTVIYVGKTQSAVIMKGDSIEEMTATIHTAICIETV